MRKILFLTIIVHWELIIFHWSISYLDHQILSTKKNAVVVKNNTSEDKNIFHQNYNNWFGIFYKNHV